MKTNPNIRVWLSYGEGIYFAFSGDQDGLNGYCSNTGLTLAYKNFCIKPRFAVFSEHESISKMMPYESLYEIGILFGGKTHDGPLIFRFMSGAGYLWGQVRTPPKAWSYTDFWTGVTSTGYSYSLEDVETICVPVEMDLCLSPHRVIGIGLTLIANFNAVKTMAGLMVSLNLGRVDQWSMR